MKKFSFAIPLLIVGLASCGPKPEEACDCLKESANKHMLAGIKPSDDQLLLPCTDYIGKFKDDKEGKVKISVCLQEIEKHLEEKKLFSINGKTPQFPAVTTPFDSILTEFSKDEYAAEYKYRHRKVKADVLLDEIESSKDGDVKLVCAPTTIRKGKLTTIATRISFAISEKETKKLAASSSEMIFDKKNHRSIEFDDRLYDSKVSSLSELYNNVASGYNPPKIRNITADYLQDYLEGKYVTNTLFGGPINALQKISEASKGLAEEVKAGNFVLLGKQGKHRIGGEYSDNYFNRLTIEGELKLIGKNGYGVPVFNLEGGKIVKNESLLELPTGKAATPQTVAVKTSAKTEVSAEDEEQYLDPEEDEHENYN